jgi:hypothetical protein
MSKLAQNLVSIWVGVVLGGFGGLLITIFWPLLFPLSLQGSSWGEDNVAIALVASFLLFAVSGFLLCRGLMGKYIREEGANTKQMLFR